MDQSCDHFCIERACATQNLIRSADHFPETIFIYNTKVNYSIKQYVDSSYIISKKNKISHDKQVTQINVYWKYGSCAGFPTDTTKQNPTGWCSSTRLELAVGEMLLSMRCRGNQHLPRSNQKDPAKWLRYLSINCKMVQGKISI